MSITKKCAPKFVFFNEKKSEGFRVYEFTAFEVVLIRSFFVQLTIL